MNADQAQSIANNYLESQPPPDPDYRWTLSAGLLVKDAWYFDYKFEHVHGIPESEWDEFTGAPGFVVPIDGSAPRDVSSAEYGDFLDQP